MALANSLIGSTNTNLVVVPAGKQYAILTLMVCNTAAEDPTGSNDSKFDLDSDLCLNCDVYLCWDLN